MMAPCTRSWLRGRKPGVTGSGVIALAVATIVQRRRKEALHRAMETLQQVRLADPDRQFDRLAALLPISIETGNRIADGMEAMERILWKVKS
jgi:hypothetical protein